MKRRILVVVSALWASLSLVSCGSSKKSGPPSGLTGRVLASQSASAAQVFGSLVYINGENDTLVRVPPLGAGASPGLMAISPTRNILAAFDQSSNSVYAVDTTKETSLGHVQLPGTTSSMVIPTASPIGYAAVPAASVNGYSFVGGVEVMNLSVGAITTTIAVTNAQTVVSNSANTELLVFSNDSDSVTVLFPGVAVPPVDTSCLTNPPNAVCVIVHDARLRRPVYAVISGSTAYIMNCGLQCGGSQPASVAVFDLESLTITNAIPVDAATWAYLSGSTLYVAGTSPTKNDCTGQTWGIPPKPTSATHCGRLDTVDVNSLKVTSTYKITDGYHDRMDMSVNGQLFIGSHDCTNIGNANNPSGEVRGCLSILNTMNGQVIAPAENGDVNGLQSFTSRYVEYVAQDGNLVVYDTLFDAPLITDYIPDGFIDVVGYVGDVKAIDFF